MNEGHTLMIMWQPKNLPQQLSRMYLISILHVRLNYMSPDGSTIPTALIYVTDNLVFCKRKYI